MCKIKNNEMLSMETNEFKQKTDRILSVIKYINNQGGITTQLMMAAACIEVQKFVYFLQDITHSKEINKKLISINQELSDIDIYIRAFKDVQYDLICTEIPKQSEDELDIIKDLKERISEGNEFCGLHQDDCDSLDSWTGLQTDIPVLWRLLYDSIKNVILELDTLYYIIKTAPPLSPFDAIETW